MTAATVLGGTEQIPAVQSSAPVYLTPAQIKTYVDGTGIANTVVMTGEYMLTEDNEIDLSGSLSDGQASATTVLTGLPSSTTAILAYIGLADTGVQPQIRWKRSSGGTLEYQIKGLWGDQGTQEFYGLWWMPTGPGSIYVKAVTADIGIVFTVVGYKVGE